MQQRPDEALRCGAGRGSQLERAQAEAERLDVLVLCSLRMLRLRSRAAGPCGGRASGSGHGAGGGRAEQGCHASGLPVCSRGSHGPVGGCTLVPVRGTPTFLTAIQLSEGWHTASQAGKRQHEQRPGHPQNGFVNLTAWAAATWPAHHQRAAWRRCRRPLGRGAPAGPRHGPAQRAPCRRWQTPATPASAQAGRRHRRELEKCPRHPLATRERGCCWAAACARVLKPARWAEQQGRTQQWAQGFPPLTPACQLPAQLSGNTQSRSSHLRKHTGRGCCLPGVLRLAQVRKEARAAPRAGQLADWLCSAARGAG